jgi:hypothetical protein
VLPALPISVFLFDHPNIWWWVPSIKLCIIYSFPLPCYLSPLTLRYPPQHPFLAFPCSRSPKIYKKIQKSGKLEGLSSGGTGTSTCLRPSTVAWHYRQYVNCALLTQYLHLFTILNVQSVFLLR